MYLDFGRFLQRRAQTFVTVARGALQDRMLPGDHFVWSLLGSLSLDFCPWSNILLSTKRLPKLQKHSPSLLPEGKSPPNSFQSTMNSKAIESSTHIAHPNLQAMKSRLAHSQSPRRLISPSPVLLALRLHLRLVARMTLETSADIVEVRECFGVGHMGRSVVDDLLQVSSGWGRPEGGPRTFMSKKSQGIVQYF